MRSATAFLIGGLTILALVAMGNAVVFHGVAYGRTPVPISVLLLFMQCMAAIAGGYVAARIAGRRPVAHSLGAGVLYLIALQFAPPAVAVFIRSPGARPLWMACSALGLTLLGCAIGGFVRHTKSGSGTYVRRSAVGDAERRVLADAVAERALRDTHAHGLTDADLTAALARLGTRHGHTNT